MYGKESDPFPIVTKDTKGIRNRCVFFKLVLPHSKSYLSSSKIKEPPVHEDIDSILK